MREETRPINLKVEILNMKNIVAKIHNQQMG